MSKFPEIKGSYSDEQESRFTIDVFKGMNQSVDISLLEPGETADAQNMKISNGVIEVVNGFQKYIETATVNPIKTAMVLHKREADSTTLSTLLVATDSNIYEWNGTVWGNIKGGLNSGNFNHLNYEYFDNSKGMNFDIVILTNGVDDALKYDGVNPQYSGNDTNLLCDSQTNPAPMGMHSIALHYDRIWCLANGDPGNPDVATGDPNTVYYSDDLDPENWDYTSEDKAGFVVLPTWDGGVCTALVNIMDNIVVFKTYNIWSIVGTYPNMYTVQRVYSAVGAIAPKSIADAGTHAYFLDRDGIYRYNGSNAENISSKVKGIINNLHNDYADDSIGIYYNNRYILAVTQKGDVNSLSTCYSESLSGWSNIGSCTYSLNVGNKLYDTNCIKVMPSGSQVYYGIERDIAGDIDAKKHYLISAYVKDDGYGSGISMKAWAENDISNGSTSKSPSYKRIGVVVGPEYYGTNDTSQIKISLYSNDNSESPIFYTDGFMINEISREEAREYTADELVLKYIYPDNSMKRLSTIIEYDELSGNFHIRRGFLVTSFLLYKDKVLFTNDSQYVMEYDTGNDYDGDEIYSYWRTPETVLGMPMGTKKIDCVYACLENEESGSMEIDIICDGKKKTVNYTLPGNRKIIKKRLLNKGKSISAQFRNINGSRFLLSNPVVMYGIDME